MKKILCYIIGHKWVANYNTSTNPYCSRCGKEDRCPYCEEHNYKQSWCDPFWVESEQEEDY